MEVCKSFLWSVLDKNGDGKLSSAELSGFVAEILQLVAKVAHCVVDTFATAFKGDVMQVIVGQAFANLDARHALVHRQEVPFEKGPGAKKRCQGLFSEGGEGGEVRESPKV